MGRCTYSDENWGENTFKVHSYFVGFANILSSHNTVYIQQTDNDTQLRKCKDEAQKEKIQKLIDDLTNLKNKAGSVYKV